MQLPFFFSTTLGKVGDTITLSEESSKHIISVLRMGIGQQLHLTDGKGGLLTAAIITEHKKKCSVEILNSKFQEFEGKPITIGISLLKNTSRFEWFLEKATEIGISSIVPLLCDRTEKQHFRLERMNGVVESALLQSRQVWMPSLCEPVKLSNFLNQGLNDCDGFIAHCIQDEKPLLAQVTTRSKKQIQILIGPEGDFTKEEIDTALQKNYLPVSLGNSRLRTETAGIVAAVLLKHIAV